MDAVRELCNNIYALCLLQSLQNIFFRSRWSCHAHVFQNRAFQKSAVLEDKGNRLHQLSLRNLLYINAPDKNLSFICIKEPADDIGQRCLASAGRPYESHSLTGSDIQGNVVQCLFFPIVTI